MRMNKINIAIVVILPIILISCSSGGGGGEEDMSWLYNTTWEYTASVTGFGVVDTGTITIDGGGNATCVDDDGDVNTVTSLDANGNIAIDIYHNGSYAGWATGELNRDGTGGGNFRNTEEGFDGTWICTMN